MNPNSLLTSGRSYIEPRFSRPCVIKQTARTSVNLKYTNESIK